MTTTHSRRRGERAVYEVLLTAGLVLLLFTAYQVWGKPAEVAHVQDRLQEQLDQTWQDPPDPAPPQAPAPTPGTAAPAPGTTAPAPTRAAVAQGRPFVKLHLPRLGLHLAVVEGVSNAALAQGPGHYPGTAMPGEAGNFAVAGHRSQGVFWHLDKLAAGDTVIVETRDSWFVYRVSATEIVPPDQTGVLDSIPGRATVTLTTCTPLWSSESRLVVHGDLTESRPKNQGAPVAPTGG